MLIQQTNCFNKLTDYRLLLSQMSIKINEISNVSTFNQLEFIWDELLSQTNHLSFFLSWKWLNLWWGNYSSESDFLYILLIEEDGVVIAIAPFYYQNNYTLRFLGTGEPENEEVATEYLDIICRQSHADKVNESLAKYFNNIVVKANKVVFNNYLPTSTVYKLLSLIENDFWLCNKVIGVRYRAKLPDTFTIFKEQCSKSLIKRLQRHRKKFESSLSGEFYICKERSDLNKTMLLLDKLHTQRWQSKNKIGAFTSKRFREFHFDFCKYSLENKSLQLWTLKASNQTIAVIYSINYNDTYYFYQSGIDTFFKPNISPGYLSHFLLIEMCIGNHINYYDFMKGSFEGSYKESFSNEKLSMYESVLLKKSLRNVPAMLKSKIKKLYIEIRNYVKIKV